MSWPDVWQRLLAARAAAGAEGAAATRAGRGQLLHELSLAAYDAYVQSGKLELLDEAVAAAEACLRATPATNAEAYSAYANELGWMLRQRYDDRDTEGDLWRAVSALKTAVGRTPEEHVDWPGRAMNLANALTELHELTGVAELLDEAIRLLEEAISLSTPATPDGGAVFSALSRSLRIRFAQGGRHSDLERSVQLDELALAALPPDHPDRAILLGNAANGLSHASTTRDATWQRAIGMWRSACELAIERQPAIALSFCLNWLRSALDRGAAADATPAAVLAQQALVRLVAAQQSRRGQEVWLRAATSLPSMAAQVHVESGNPGRAVLAVEHARAALLAATLAGAGGVDTVTLDQLHDLARRDAPLAYLVPGVRAIALIVTAGGVSALRLPALTEAAVLAAVDDLYRGYYHRHENVDGWRASFDKVTRWLWTAVMGPLIGSLGSHQRVNLLPGGLLALLPLHAAWEPAAGRGATGRRYAGDDMLITLQPNARLLLRAAPACTPASARRLVAVAEPRPTSGRPLRFAVAEASAAAATFGATETIVHEEATVERVIASIPDADVIHLACHGQMRIDDPLAGGLVLAGDRLLTVGTVLDARLRARLVVASACESASIPPGLPDQIANMAAALLQAGSHAVLATAFAVDDLTALVLATRFYAEWRHGTPGPLALRAAVAFLRDTTNADKLRWVDELRRAGWPPAVTEPLAKVLALTRPAERSFAHPVEWAPFTWWGRHVAI
jgi:hypothetical protein